MTGILRFVQEARVRTRRLRPLTRLGIVAVALALFAGAIIGAVRAPAWTPLFAVLAFAGVAMLMLLRQASVSLSGDHLVVQNLLRVYALPLAGIRRPVRDSRGGLALVVYFHPDYPRWPGGVLPQGWRARHRRKRLRQIPVFALGHDDELLPDILRRAQLARDEIELGRPADPASDPH